MKIVKVAFALAAAGVAASSFTPAMADDPRDPTMRSRAARDADAAEIRRLNREQSAYVQKRDAEYAKGWTAYRERYGDRRETARDDDRGREDRNYASARADYASAMADWRRAVSDCRRGYYEACDGY